MKKLILGFASTQRLGHEWRFKDGDYQMKSSLEEAAALFRENEMMFGDVKQDKEKANLYRGLALLAEGLRHLEERVERLEAEPLQTEAAAHR